MPPGTRQPDDLFEAARRDRMAQRGPLAARMRPTTIDDVVGQRHLLAPGDPLRATTQRRLVGDLIGQLREPDDTWIEHDRDRIRADRDILLSEGNQLVRDRDDLQRKPNGARSNISRLAERRVTELFPDGPGKTMPS